MTARIYITAALLFACFFILLEGFGQPVNRVAVINSDKGLSQNSVYAISKDSKGFLWIGTGDGLNRYDGKDMVVFRNTPVPSQHKLKGFSITSGIAEDDHHNLWFSTERNLVKFHLPSKTFTEIIPFTDSLHHRGNKIMVSADTLENTIWFISAAKCLYGYNYVNKAFHQYDFPVQTGKNLFQNPSAVCDKNGNIWITSSEGLFCFNKTSHAWQRYHPTKKIQKIALGSFGKIWLLNEKNLFLFDPDSHKIITYENAATQQANYISLASDQKGQAWVGTIDGNLHYASAKGRKVFLAGDINKIAGSQNILELRCLFIDTSNLLWIGTEGGGVIKLDLNPRNFNLFPSAENYTVKALYTKSIFCDDDGKVWVGSFKKGIYIFDPENLIATHLNVPQNKNFSKIQDVVFSIKKDSENIYWLGYDGCLIAYDKTNNQYFFHPIPVEASNRSPLISHISVEKDHLLVSSTAGLFKVTSSEQGKNASFKKILSTSIMESMYTSDGTLWASSVYQGLLKIEEGQYNSFISLFPENGFRCLTEDKENNILWAASQAGLLAYDLSSGKYKFYDERNGLLNSYLYGVIKTGNEIWVSTNKGIARGALSLKHGQKLPEIRFNGYTQEDGLQSNEFNTGAYGISKNNVIYFGGINGVNWFLPNRIANNKNKPSVAITTLKINDSLYFNDTVAEFLQSITTTFDNNTFTIKFIGLEFSNPAALHYKFKLDGLEKEWTVEKNAREVRYANLSPGRYVFRVTASNSDNVESDETTLEVLILPPFYSRWWFRLFVTVLIISAVIFLTQKLTEMKLKKRIRELEKQKALEDERHRISKEMHDDLGAGLTQISLISEAAKKRNSDGKFPKEELNDISSTSRQLIENVSEIIWAMNPEFDTLSSMIAYLREQLGKLLEYSGKQYYIQLPEDYADINISNLKRKNISMLMKEAVNNAIKHSNATSIYVRMSLAENNLQIEIKDNGMGFNTENISKGNGIKNYSFRAALLQGTSKVVSKKTGTEVYFNIPLGNGKFENEKKDLR